jgi:hypothetical protein
MVKTNGIYFKDAETEKTLGVIDTNFVPIPLFKGMEVTIHGYDALFKVVDWNYHHGHQDEEAGLRIFLKSSGR